MFNDIINFDISYQSLERYPDMKYVIRNDTDEAIGVVGKDFKAASHPEFFGKIRETWQELLPDLADDVQITNKVSRNGAWALEQVIFPKAKTIIETDKHSTEIALRFIYWHGIDGSCRNNCLVGAIDFFCQAQEHQELHDGYVHRGHRIARRTIPASCRMVSAPRS
jgi:hypothetical protein